MRHHQQPEVWALQTTWHSPQQKEKMEKQGQSGLDHARAHALMDQKYGKIYGMNAEEWSLDRTLFRRPGEQGKLF